ncbi:MAG: sigma-70 family RNA polymerase sigma factor [Anaerolineae bacterium]|nr:sigma-70 family RNA polymerase sigma factor [Anaerolineae bacterium]
MDSKQAMIAAFGTETGRKLYAVATKLSRRYGIDVDDVASNVTLTALESQTRYGFVHINTVAQRVKNALYDTYDYGVNRYYGSGYAEVSADAETEDGGTLLDTLEAPDTYRAVDVKLVVEQLVGELSALDQEIVKGLFAGLDPKEIAANLGCHWDSVYKHKRILARQFAAALA